MSWKFRAKGVDGLQNFNNPDYGDDDGDAFTIALHHSGQFITMGKTKYCGGEVELVDYCDPDMLSMVEVHSMVKEIGVDGCLRFYYSKRGVNDCSELVLLKDDLDVMNLVQWVDSNRVVGIFVEHDGLQFVVGGVESGDGVDFDIKDDKESDEDDESGEGEEDDTVNTDGESELSDFSVDSEEDVSDDDVLFDGNVDVDAEWGGLHLPDKGILDEKASGSKTIVVGNRKMYNGGPVFDPKLDGKDPKFELGMCFTDTETFRKAVRQHGIKQGRVLQFIMNDKRKVQVKCKHKTCPWVIYASRIHNEDTMVVKTYNGKHRCSRKQNIPHANVEWLANTYQDQIWTNPTWPVQSMMALMQKEQKIVVKRHSMYRAKKRVAEMGSVEESEQFALLWRYAAEVKKTNPGTTVKIKSTLIDDKPVFKRLYICWGALKKGLVDGCRPIFCLDGCHLKSHAGGILLSAVGIDGNNHMFPFAYAIVEKENKKSWSWFLEHLIEDLNITNPHLWTVMSDKQKGLVDAVEKLLPDAEHRNCVMHLYKNFKLVHRGLALKNLLWSAARASRMVEFNKAMDALKKRDDAAFQWLVQKPPKHWSRSHFNTFAKSDILLNNYSESFNSQILSARAKPIIEMLESLRLSIMKKMVVKRNIMARYEGDICPKIVKILDELKRKALGFSAHWNGEDEFEIQNGWGSSFRVHLGQQTCCCRMWDLTGIPCAHAICAMFELGKKPEDYIHPYYTKESYMKAYANMMGVLHGCEVWPEVGIEPLLPPISEKMPGRPKKHNRRKDKDEESDKKGKKEQKTKMGKRGVVMTCSLCHKPNHNKRGCPQRKQDTVMEPSTQGSENLPSDDSFCEELLQSVYDAFEEYESNSNTQQSQIGAKGKGVASSSSMPATLTEAVNTGMVTTRAKKNIASSSSMPATLTEVVNTGMVTTRAKKNVASSTSMPDTYMPDTSMPVTTRAKKNVGQKKTLGVRPKLTVKKNSGVGEQSQSTLETAGGQKKTLGLRPKLTVRRSNSVQAVSGVSEAISGVSDAVSGVSEQSTLYGTCWLPLG